MNHVTNDIESQSIKLEISKLPDFQMYEANRLVVSKIVLENFKSYSGKQEVGPFHGCFSAIVGPNGSGKSNVIDAILFVFGKQAKKLRFNKISELIYNSESKPDYAKVTIHFHEIVHKNGSDIIIPNSEFSLARAAHRNNKSEYNQNRKKTKKKRNRKRTFYSRN